MQNMAQMFGMARQESLQREEVLRSEICETAKATSKDAKGLAAQVSHLTTTVNVLQSQLSTNADFSVDAIQQVREEFKAQIDAVSKNNQASNAGGAMPHTGTGSSKDVPLVNSTGRPMQSKTDESEYAIQCAFCLGSVPKCIAKHCADCDLHFHPGHLHLHRDEWPCPLVDHDLCPRCASHIEEHENVLKCEVCQHELHTQCFCDHSPCPDG